MLEDKLDETESRMNATEKSLNDIEKKKDEVERYENLYQSVSDYFIVDKPIIHYFDQKFLIHILIVKHYK